MTQEAPTPVEAPPTFTMPVSLVQAGLNYLETRPHKEVRQLIDGILACNPKTEAPANDGSPNQG